MVFDVPRYSFQKLQKRQRADFRVNARPSPILFFEFAKMRGRMAPAEFDEFELLVKVAIVVVQADRELLLVTPRHRRIVFRKHRHETIDADNFKVGNMSHDF